MRKTALALSLLLLVGPAPAMEVKGNTITLTADELRQCTEGGGCMVIPNAQLQAQVDQLMMYAFMQGKEACKNSI